MVRSTSQEDYRKYAFGAHNVGCILRDIELDDLLEVVVSPSHLESHAIINSKWLVSYLAVFNQEESAWFVTVLSYDVKLEGSALIGRYYRVSLW